MSKVVNIFHLVEHLSELFAPLLDFPSKCLDSSFALSLRAKIGIPPATCDVNVDWWCSYFYRSRMLV